ncbi:ceramidase domain-containing protein [Cellulosimicrobium marinum]|uniref:ceramidase domain-containing protein n=1 Tax=Cellulosimicrobium marinum TaxID=1638992 RepID=UPI001E3DA21C|nr:ceramidase domain-containing protein [Cellulosimicrobium marinum]MCB7136257.1 ceramidase domain-containing protein [Cellulosimicrobium marinum]
MEGACELAGGTPWAEPLSTWTSLAFVVAGLAIVVRALRVPDDASPVGVRVALGCLVALIGVGSVVQHGPSPAWNPVVHDPPLLGALALVAADAVADLTGRRLRTSWWLAPTLLSVVLAATSVVASTAAQVVAAVVAVGASLLRAGRRPAVRRRTVTALVLLAVGGGIGTLTRAGWPLCDADGPLGVTLQGHAVWHVLAAVALWVLAPTLGTRSRGHAH